MSGGATGGGHGGGSATGLNDGGTTLLDGLDEVALEPGGVHLAVDGLAVDGGVVDIGVHGGGVVTPDDDVLDLVGGDAALGADHAHHAIVVEAGHGGEVLPGDLGGEMAHDESVGVGGVTDNEDLEVGGSLGVGGLAHGLEDTDVLLHQILTLHTGLAGESAEKDGGVSARETNFGVVGLDDLSDEGEVGVVKFHVDAFHGLLGERKVDKAEGDLLVLTKHLTGGDLLGERVTDLASGTSDGDLDLFFEHTIEN